MIFHEGTVWIDDDLGRLSGNNEQSMLFFPSGRAVGLPKVVLFAAALVGRAALDCGVGLDMA